MQECHGAPVNEHVHAISHLCIVAFDETESLSKQQRHGACLSEKGDTGDTSTTKTNHEVVDGVL
jgi:hypothetical protein